MSHSVCFNISQEILNENIHAVRRNWLLSFILARVEVSSDRENGKRVIAFVIRCILCGIDFKEAIVFVGTQSHIRYTDVLLLSQVVRFGNKLERIDHLPTARKRQLRT